jgi:hypothetical protein
MIKVPQILRARPFRAEPSIFFKIARDNWLTQLTKPSQQMIAIPMAMATA